MGTVIKTLLLQDASYLISSLFPVFSFMGVHVLYICMDKRIHAADRSTQSVSSQPIKYQLSFTFQYDVGRPPPLCQRNKDTAGIGHLVRRGEKGKGKSSY